ncbi:MAG: ATP synthase subunit alpha [Candidatus Giovannonibacteria bacterium GW2011_GWA2_53_7]|uniref:ATP synthase subunit alpha n=1 Tax=Candidatus Giovannonibacteria bacterium GW2011_GWA2_53_7 TaxID=1618650 RepID=A0A0G2A2U1_9BACT|nr:MAG: ATP synthase subunit alpha [Candidatus Giovannonibacteria bacterium GW2011_GWA2_53_7]
MKTTDHVIELLKQELQGFKPKAEVSHIGTVVEVGDGIARIVGLGQAKSYEMLEFPDNIFGVALNLEEDSVGAMILGDYEKLKEGDTVKATGRVLEVPVGPELVGRVVNPLGQPIDGKGPVKAETTAAVEKVAPGVITRQGVSAPVQTGLKAIDAMIPIGRGQRELIIGDRQTGKTAIAIDTIINQSGQNLISIYVAIGQKASKVAKIVAELEARGAMKHSIVVVASASDPAALSFIAPFVRRPPGREAYPGDIFYLHSRLLERAAKLNKEAGGGSLTALPIIETQAGDISAYIPTNVISITDGQIYLESDLFYQGIRPALNVGLSVSRVGSKAQVKAMKKVAGKLRLELAQYRELAAFAQFGSDLDETTKQQLERGKRLTEILKQRQYEPMPVQHQVAIIYAAINGYLDAVPVEKMADFEAKFHTYLRDRQASLMDKLTKAADLTDALETELKAALDTFTQHHDYEDRGAGFTKSFA